MLTTVAVFWVRFLGGSLDKKKLPSHTWPNPGAKAVTNESEVYFFDPMQDAFLLRWDGKN